MISTRRLQLFGARFNRVVHGHSKRFERFRTPEIKEDVDHRSDPSRTPDVKDFEDHLSTQVGSILDQTLRGSRCYYFGASCIFPTLEMRRRHFYAALEGGTRLGFSLPRRPAADNMLQKALPQLRVRSRGSLCSCRTSSDRALEKLLLRRQKGRLFSHDGGYRERSVVRWMSRRRADARKAALFLPEPAQQPQLCEDYWAPTALGKGRANPAFCFVAEREVAAQKHWLANRQPEKWRNKSRARRASDSRDLDPDRDSSPARRHIAGHR